MLRFLIVLLIGLAVLGWVSSRIVSNLTNDWFQRDMASRAQLAVNGARSALVEHWNDADTDQIRQSLTALAHDERILGAAACKHNGDVIAATHDFSPQISLVEIAAANQPSGANTAGVQPSGHVVSLAGGRVFVTAIPITADDSSALGFIVLVNDMAYIDRREEEVHKLILIAFIVLACAASLMTIIATRVVRQGWTAEIRRFLRGGSHRREFQPIVKDLRNLVARISTERSMEDQNGAWTPARLKQTLAQYLHGEKILVLANREPYVHDRVPGGAIKVLHPASGLVTAIEPVMRACGGTWIAHGSGGADRETADRNGRLRVPPGEESYTLRRVWLTPQQEKGYYYGFANEGLWPLCHIAHARPVFRTEDWEHYQHVNQMFADAVVEESDTDDPIILIQDYHFAVAPRMIRESLPKATIITFWHIPWPNSERFGICPWSQELLEGILGSSIIGFHTQLHCNNFIDSIDRFLEARIDREQFAVIQQQRSTLVRAYPISVEWPNHWVDAVPPVAECRQSVLEELHLKPNALIGVGIDRLDYTKGVEERLWGVERLLERFPEFCGRFTFVQLAAPSRTVIERYRQLNDSVEQLADRINNRVGDGEYRPVILLRSHHEPPTVFRYLRAANLCYVSSLHDGMNLVAKEFIAARDDERGVLILSHFTGASRELTEALIVNPYDLEEVSDALAAALYMRSDEQAERMRSMRALVAEYNIYRWAGRMLIDAATLRARERSRRSARRRAHYERLHR
ncbi:MAG TPA: trehalose-6-phosphate synthase [Phycisphaerales bacterium]|nr:trehalose-6-phosphate synthase [Phycisphaerales bacterium]